LQSQPKKDWSAAAKHYRIAMSAYPSGDTCHPYSLQALFCCVITLLLDLLIRSASCCNVLSWVGFSACEFSFVLLGKLLDVLFVSCCIYAGQVQ